MKDNFLLKKKQGEIFEALEDIEAGKLIKGIYKYVNTGDSGLEGALKAAFVSIKIDIEENEKKYKERCEINKINGEKGGAPKGNQNAKKEKTTENNQTVKKTTENNMNNHIHNHLEDKKDNNRGTGEEEGKEETFKIDEKIHFAEFVTMTNAEYDKLVSTYGKDFADRCIEKLNNYKGSSGKKYKNDYRAIKSWVVDSIKNSMKETSVTPRWFENKQEVKKLSAEEIAEMDKILSDIEFEME